MANCVYHACADHLHYLGITTTWTDYELFRILKIGCGYRIYQDTWGGVVPFIVRNLALSHGLGVRIQHRLITKSMYIHYPEATIFQQAIAAQSDFGEYADPMTLEPAVYLMLGSQHAVFALRVPQSHHPVMALQLYRRQILGL